MTVREAATNLGIGAEVVLRLLARGYLKRVSEGPGATQVDVASVEALIEATGGDSSAIVQLAQGPRGS